MHLITIIKHMLDGTYLRYVLYAGVIIIVICGVKVFNNITDTIGSWWDHDTRATLVSKLDAANTHTADLASVNKDIKLALTKTIASGSITDRATVDLYHKTQSNKAIIEVITAIRDDRIAAIIPVSGVATIVVNSSVQAIHTAQITYVWNTYCAFNTNSECPLHAIKQEVAK